MIGTVNKANTCSALSLQSVQEACLKGMSRIGTTEFKEKTKEEIIAVLKDWVIRVAKEGDTVQKNEIIILPEVATVLLEYIGSLR